MGLTLYHNPRCSTSRKVLELLREHGVQPQVVEYLQEPLSAEQLMALASIIDGGVENLLRKKEPKFQELLAGVDDVATIVMTIAQFPILLNRPIVSNGQRAIAARPPESALLLVEA